MRWSISATQRKLLIGLPLRAGETLRAATLKNRDAPGRIFKPYFTGIDLHRDCAPIASCSFFRFSQTWSGRQALGAAMPLYFFRIRNGSYSGASDQGTECADHDAAWKELTKVCTDVATGISRRLQPNSEWQMEMLDESRQPVFRIRIVSEALD